MRRLRYDAAVLGGGSAGMAAAVKIAERGKTAAIIERDLCLGGILNQCIHNGFGLHYFSEELTGPEFAERFEGMVKRSSIDLFFDMTAMDIRKSEEGLRVYTFSREFGLTEILCGAVVLAMGCRERNRGNIGIPGTRPSGIFTAGLAQRLVNIDGYLPGKKAVIIGSGDIGLIMARRMTWIGAKVEAVVEIQPYPSGLTRNIVQCLNDFSIPLYLSHVVTRIHGRDRVEAVTISPLRDGGSVESESFTVECDTILLSVGLIPDNELSKKAGVELNQVTGGPLVDGNLMTTVPGIFACGNVLHVHDLVDWVAAEAELCGSYVCDYLDGSADGVQIRVSSGPNVRYAVPNRIVIGRHNTIFFRPLIVKNNARLSVKVDGTTVIEKKLVHVQPSEMIQVDIGPEILDSADPERKLFGTGAELPILEVGLG